MMMTGLPLEERTVIMDYKKTIDCGIWSEPDEKGRIRKLDMRTCQDVFDELKDKLESAGLLPDEYFIMDYSIEDDKKPVFSEAICSVDFGNSEGIYLDIRLHYYDENRKPAGKSFATGKTLGETTADFYKMSLAAGECSMLLNGFGSKIENNAKIILIADEVENEEIANALVLQKQFNEFIGRSNEMLYSFMDSVSDNNIALNNEDKDELEV